MRTRTRALLLALGALIVAAPVSAGTGTAAVTVDEYTFTAATITIVAGDKVQWTNAGTFEHTVTSDGTLGLLSIDLPSGSDGTHTFSTAGTFAYHCSIHASMKGKVRVPITATPSAGAAGTTFTITLGTAAAPAGYRYVVQRRAPGGSFVAWKTTGAQTLTVPLTKKGKWAFRSRLKRTSNGALSAFSPVATITVS
ncbi:MAG: cupredoxin domain-containing protein [Chloroflexota bacterium]